jgi:hypothetical protein
MKKLIAILFAAFALSASQAQAAEAPSCPAGQHSEMISLSQSVERHTLTTTYFQGVLWGQGDFVSKQAYYEYVGAGSGDYNETSEGSGVFTQVNWGQGSFTRKQAYHEYVGTGNGDYVQVSRGGERYTEIIPAVYSCVADTVAMPPVDTSVTPQIAPRPVIFGGGIPACSGPLSFGWHVDIIGGGCGAPVVDTPIESLYRQLLGVLTEMIPFLGK